MNALDSLKLKNGLQTTNTVLGKQQSGVDAAQKANPEQTAAQMNMNTAQAMLHGKENTLTPPKDAHEEAVRRNQETAEGIMNGSIPIVKKEEPKPQAEQKTEEPKKQMSYAEMFKALNGGMDGETPEQKARRERRERSKARIAAIGDGLRALSNMYFATQGAKVIHDPNADMTKAVNKRQEMLREQREKNKTAWLNGYLKAQALDEEAKKSGRTWMEQVRHNKELEDIAKGKLSQGDRRLDQGDTRLEQNQQKINLTGDRLNELARHNKVTESIGQQNANSRSLSAAKAGNGKRATASTKAQQQWCYDQVIEFANQSTENAEKVINAISSVGGKQLTLQSASGIYNIINGYSNRKQSSSGGKAKASSKGGSSKGGTSKGSAKSKFSIFK